MTSNKQEIFFQKFVAISEYLNFKYDTYEEYLDSLVSEEDHKYLQDEEMARAIAELGYR